MEKEGVMKGFSGLKSWHREVNRVCDWSRLGLNWTAEMFLLNPEMTLINLLPNRCCIVFFLIKSLSSGETLKVRLGYRSFKPNGKIESSGMSEPFWLRSAVSSGFSEEKGGVEVRPSSGNKPSVLSAYNSEAYFWFSDILSPFEVTSSLSTHTLRPAQLLIHEPPNRAGHALRPSVDQDNWVCVCVGCFCWSIVLFHF